MAEGPLVSAIATFLNGEPYLEEAIDSVFRQTYRSWELVLCDDGSTDGSTEIARAYAERWPDRIRYVEHEGHENRGLCATRILGLEHARGELITWIDADDVWLPEKLERQLALLAAHPEAAMVYGHGEYWYSWTGKPSDAGRDRPTAVGVDTDTIVQPPAAAISFVRKEGHVPGDSAVLVRREALDEVGGFDPTFPDAGSDNVVWFKICLERPVYVSSDIWFRYRQHEASFVAQARQTVTERRVRLRYLHGLSEYLRDRGREGDEAWQAVQAEIAMCRESVRTRAGEASLRGLAGLQRAWWLSSSGARRLVGRLLPQPARASLGIRLKGREYTPPLAWVGLGGLRRISPIDSRRGDGRGTACDHFYVEQFLELHADDIRGRVLEIGSWYYARKFGDGTVTDRHALYPVSGDPRSTLAAHIGGDGVPTASFDCVILAEPLPTRATLDAAIATAAQALVPGGVLLAAVPGVAHTRPGGLEDGEVTRYTTAAVRSSVESHFGAGNVEVVGNGNVLAALALLHGIAAEELDRDELEHRDPRYELAVCVRAVKAP
jgi:glycosyltransferase involved in cell wall biosynthesis